MVINQSSRVLDNQATPLQSAIQTAREWIIKNPIMLDFETTGLGSTAEIIEVSMVDIMGEVLFDSLIKPSKSIPADATAVHGITNDMVKDAPTFGDHFSSLLSLINCGMVLSYNWDYDRRIFRQTMAIAEIETQLPIAVRSGCLMRLYAKYHGEMDEFHGSYRWQKLDAAIYQCQIPFPKGQQHRAAYDAELARRLLWHMAGAEDNPEDCYA